ncbi:hypothetical protein [Thermomonospora umbrina]|uniref:hypothetical protein n=1 Tax=Thermomonospora umbrina TaxID=111806 RepID=UPI001B884F56|nr:hypothetical protein [Thermomonospora umbrina]
MAVVFLDGRHLGTLPHAVGRPIPHGGSRSIVSAMTTALKAHGGRITTGHRVESLRDLPRHRALLLDTAPAGPLNPAGDLLPDDYTRSLRRFRHGGGVCKVDLALSGPVPWTAPGRDLAGTLHVAGGERHGTLAPGRADPCSGLPVVGPCWSRTCTHAERPGGRLGGEAVSAR